MRQEKFIPNRYAIGSCVRKSRSDKQILNSCSKYLITKVSNSASTGNAAGNKKNEVACPANYISGFFIL